MKVAKIAHVEKIELTAGQKTTFSFYQGADNLPVLDMGELLASVLGLGDSEYVTLGEESDTFSVFISSPNLKNKFLCNFLNSSFAPMPEEAAAMHRGNFKRWQLLVINPKKSYQFMLPMPVPESLVYVHCRATWGIYHENSEDATQIPYFSDKNATISMLKLFVRPFVNLVSLVEVDTA